MSNITKYNEKDSEAVISFNTCPLSEESKTFLNNLPENIRKDFEAHATESSFWKSIENDSTPFDFLKERKGSYNKDTGTYKMLEYFPPDYTISELNRLFPGWWEEGMILHEVDYKLRTRAVSGYLCVEYPTLNGKKITKRWACASAKINVSKETDEKTGMLEASNADDLEKSAESEWIKRAGKKYGIGLDIYHQRITPALRIMFEDIIRDWGEYAENAKKIVATLTTGHAFRNYLRELPTKEQTKRIMIALDKIPKDTKNSNGQLVHPLIWGNFVKCSNASNEERVKTESYISKIEEIADNHNKNKE